MTFRTYLYLSLVLLIASLFFSCTSKPGSPDKISGPAYASPVNIQAKKVYFLRLGTDRSDTMLLNGYARTLQAHCPYRNMNYLQNGADIKVSLMKSCPKDSLNQNILECYTDKYGIIFRNDVHARVQYYLKTDNDSVNTEIHQLMDFINLSPP